MIAVKNLVKHFQDLRVLDDISFSVRHGEIAVVIGPSGSGKSTLLRCLNGLETFDAGEVQVDDITLTAAKPNQPRHQLLLQLRRRVGMVFQQFHLFPHMTALGNVTAGPLYVLKLPRAQAEAEATALLERVGLADKLHARPDQLSGGQAQRVAIARALAMKPEVILFDEPTSALDPNMAHEVFRVITDLADAKQTMIIATHAMNLARRIAHTVHVLHEGRILETGPPEQVFEQPEHNLTRSFLAQLTSD